MSIEIGSRWVKDVEVVEVTNFYESISIWCIWFIDSKTIAHILTERDFLEQYKPYDEFVYRWVYVVNNAIYFTDEKMTCYEFKKAYIGEKIELFACISETKEKR